MNKEFVTPFPDSRMVGIIHEIQIQTFAMSNLGRMLSDIELNRVAQAFFDDETTNYSLLEVYSCAIEYALNGNVDWEITDKDYSS